MPCLRNDFSSSADTASSSTGTSRGSSSTMVTSLPNRRKIDANSTPTAPLPRITIDFGTCFRWMASSLVMMRVRSISIPGTLRGADPVATMISLRAASVCASPSNTSTPPCPVRRAVPLIQSILFFLKRNSTPLVRPPTIRSFRSCTWDMLIATADSPMRNRPIPSHAGRSSARARARAGPWSECTPTAGRFRQALSASRRRRLSGPVARRGSRPRTRRCPHRRLRRHIRLAQCDLM